MMTLFPLHAEKGTLDFQGQKPVSLTQTVKPRDGYRDPVFNRSRG